MRLGKPTRREEGKGEKGGACVGFYYIYVSHFDKRRKQKAEIPWRVH